MFEFTYFEIKLRNYKLVSFCYPRLIFVVNTFNDFLLVTTTSAREVSVKSPSHPMAVGRVASTTPEFKAITKWVQIIRALRNKTQELQRKSRSLLRQSGASCVNYVSVLITPSPPPTSTVSHPLNQPLFHLRALSLCDWPPVTEFQSHVTEGVVPWQPILTKCPSTWLFCFILVYMIYI